jgi:hypothetical protein
MRVAAARGLRMPASASAAIQHRLIARRDGNGFGKSIRSPSPSWRSFANFSRRKRRLGYPSSKATRRSALLKKDLGVQRPMSSQQPPVQVLAS